MSQVSEPITVRLACTADKRNAPSLTSGHPRRTVCQEYITLSLTDLHALQRKGAHCLQLPDIPEVFWGTSSARHMAGEKGDAGDGAAVAAALPGAPSPRQPRPLLLCSCRSGFGILFWLAS